MYISGETLDLKDPGSNPEKFKTFFCQMNKKIKFSKPFLLHYDNLSTCYYSSLILNYLESINVLGLCRVIELHIGKRRPFLFIISFVPSLGTPIPMKKSI
jgi:hypothetical protein